jgi:hypothetical protein
MRSSPAQDTVRIIRFVTVFAFIKPPAGPDNISCHFRSWQARRRQLRILRTQIVSAFFAGYLFVNLIYFFPETHPHMPGSFPALKSLRKKRFQSSQAACAFF